MKNYLIYIFVFLNLSGCATSVVTYARFSDQTLEQPCESSIIEGCWVKYPATKLDKSVINFSVKGMKTGFNGHNEDDKGFQYIVAPVIFVFAVLDAIVSVVTDTIFLPYDMHLEKKLNENKNT